MIYGYVAQAGILYQVYVTNKDDLKPHIRSVFVIIGDI